jgi:acyl-CoA reductase-like NAD-dependent aldehyde dehydrogenase
MSAEPFARIQIAHLEGRSQSLRLRQTLFHSLHATLTSSESAIKQAIAADTGNSDADIALEYSLALSELRAHYETLDLKTEVTLAHSIENPTGTTNVGIVYVIPAQRTLFYAVLSPLCAALAAGNCVVLEVRFLMLG